MDRDQKQQPDKRAAEQDRFDKDLYEKMLMRMADDGCPNFPADE